MVRRRKGQTGREHDRKKMQDQKAHVRIVVSVIGIGLVLVLGTLLWRGRAFPASAGAARSSTQAVSEVKQSGSARAVPSQTTFYVSPAGDGRDGLSWATAWQTPGQINWQAVQPGDTIVLDGGQDGITYQGGITLVASGQEDRPITLRASDEMGHDGQVVLFGGRSTLLPYCGQTDYVPQNAALVGISINASWLVIDGGRWRGIAIHGFNQSGILLNGGTRNITLRNLEIYDNGTLKQTGNGWRSDDEGIKLGGYNHVFERLIIHDNGQDAIQSGSKIGNFTLRESWLYNSRPSPDDPSRSFNSCTHSDGIQLWNGGVESGVTVERSVLGPGFMQGLLLGEGSTNTVVNDVVVRDTLFVGASNASIHNQNSKPRNWLLERVTSIRPPGQKNQNIYFTGTGLTIRDSLFVGGTSMYVPKSGDYTNNCQWNVNGTKVGNRVNPQIASQVEGMDVTGLAKGNYKPGITACIGSSLTSAQQLFR